MSLESERAALMQTSRDWARAVTGGDFDLILSYWADDAIVMAPGQPAAVGKAAIRDFLQQTTAIPGFTITWEPEQATIASSGDVGYIIERNRVGFTDADGTARTQFGKAVTIWRKNAAGAWKCVVDTWNENPTEHALPMR